jgi:hypothetical protein
MATSESRDSKTCQTCGRTIEWRKKWERDWHNVRYCSDSCRSHKPGPQAAALEAAILHLLQQRGVGKTICPSEAARAVAATDEEAAWRPLMEPARQAARRLVASGRIVMTQGGRMIDPSRAKGPVRLRLK